MFYHGLIKAAVGLLHLERKNRRGASLKLKDAQSTLAPFSATMMGFDIGRLMTELKQRLELIEDNSVSLVEVLSLPKVKIHDSE